jgi:hypothetical protein
MRVRPWLIVGALFSIPVASEEIEEFVGCNRNDRLSDNPDRAQRLGRHVEHGLHTLRIRLA